MGHVARSRLLLVVGVVGAAIVFAFFGQRKNPLSALISKDSPMYCHDELKSEQSGKTVFVSCAGFF